MPTIHFVAGEEYDEIDDEAFGARVLVAGGIEEDSIYSGNFHLIGFRSELQTQSFETETRLWGSETETRHEILHKLLWFM